MSSYATRYADRIGDSNQSILESDLAEMKARVLLAEDVAEKARGLIETARLALKDKISVVSFKAVEFNDLIEAIEKRDDHLEHGPTKLTVRVRGPIQGDPQEPPDVP